MGKSWKEKPGKYRHNKDFQKKQKHKNPHMPPKQRDPYPNDFNMPSDDILGDTGHNPLRDMM